MSQWAKGAATEGKAGRQRELHEHRHGSDMSGRQVAGQAHLKRDHYRGPGIPTDVCGKTKRFQKKKMINHSRDLK